MTTASGNNLPLRCVTIDVEEYYHIEAAHGHVKRGQWDSMPSRVEASIDVLLELFARHNQHGTFFILGDVARRCPAVAGRIAAAGHEVACHGYEHDHLSRMNFDLFEADVVGAKKLLEDQIGRAVIGYRAPTFSVTPDTAWAVDALLEAGFRYDASIFPVRHPAYGVPEAPRSPFMLAGADGKTTLLEIPPLTWHVGGRNLPVAGGGYFRLLPLWLMKCGLAQAAIENRPAILYFHPWEFDPDIPRLPLSLTGKLRTYTGLDHALVRLDEIMSTPARWSPIIEALEEFEEMAMAERPFQLRAA